MDISPDKAFLRQWLLVSVCSQQGETGHVWSISARAHGLASVCGLQVSFMITRSPGFPGVSLC